jgi:phospholipid transport system substrate-binding protein
MIISRAVFTAAMLLVMPTLSRAATPEQAPIAALNGALIAAMKAGSAKSDFAARYAALAPVVETTFNFPVLLQETVGLLWPTVPGAQQEELANLFKQFTVASYVNGFDNYSGQSIMILPAERDIGALKVVETEILGSDGEPLSRLDYVMSKGDTGWQATDVLLKGTISDVGVQSSDFSNFVQAGDATQLIAALKVKIATLSGGQLRAK